MIHHVIKCLIISCFGIILFFNSTQAAQESDTPGIVNRGEYLDSGLGGGKQSHLGQEQDESSVFSVGVYPSYTPELPKGKDVNLVIGHCNICHANTYIQMQPPLTREKWAATVRKMVEKFGAPISEDEEKKIVEYLGSYFTPETRK